MLQAPHGPRLRGRAKLAAAVLQSSVLPEKPCPCGRCCCSRAMGLDNGATGMTGRPRRPAVAACGGIRKDAAMRFISSGTHGVIDYIYALVLIGAPYVL